MPLAALLGAVVLLASACGTNTRDAAAVDGVAIGDDRLRDEMADLAEFIELNPDAGLEVRSGEGLYQIDTVAFQLTELINSEVYGQVLDDLGGSVLPDDEAPIRVSLSDFQSTPWLDGFIEGQAVLAAVSRIVTDEVSPYDSAEAWFEQNSALFSCARHILVADQALSQEIFDRIAAGETFEAMAAEFGTDGTSAVGGDLGCTVSTNYVPSFAAVIDTIPVGVVSDPFETDFGWHIARVDARGDDLSFADVQADAEAAYQQVVQTEVGPLVSSRLNELLADVDVSVSRRYGAWNGQQVVPLNQLG